VGKVIPEQICISLTLPFAWVCESRGILGTYGALPPWEFEALLKADSYGI